MTVQLRELLEHVLEGEPDLGDEVEAVFRRADRLRRRRTRALLTAGLFAVAAIVAAGYLLATTLLPARGVGRPAVRRPNAVPVPFTIADPVPAVIARVVDGGGMHIARRLPGPAGAAPTPTN